MLGAPRAAPVTPRLVATDLDGTLLRTDGSVSRRTAAALRGAQEAGVDVVFVTARPPRWLDVVADAVGGHGVVLCLNGAVVYEPATGTVLESRTMPDDVVLALVADLRAALPGVVFAVERVDGFAAERGFPDDRPGPDDLVLGERVESVLDGATGKLLARCAAVPDAELVACVDAVLAGRAVLGDSGASGLAEITGPGVTKGATLARWSAARGVRPEEVWAFGDMPNDLPMLRWAGRAFGVANAHPDVLAAVHEVCGSNDDDGVARVLERLLRG
ncbi:HAD family hydrolase [Actinotalea sp. JY-7885]|uniref:HAD family hydrolase n=1 Tax=Actinotalea sp. JY-7885 TaxID=2758576 RepID=UPI00281637FE|nr:HAD family hydrolase [Actinotalea sp. JY-7885]